MGDHDPGAKLETILSTKKVLILDMNNTFMFGEDRFGDNEEYSVYYRSIGGMLSSDALSEIMRNTLSYLGSIYPKEAFRNHFPSIEQAIKKTYPSGVAPGEIEKIVSTFSYHEHGYIPDEYGNTLFQLRERFTLAAVIDIWAPKSRWLETFKRHGIDKLFSALSFSSDHGMVKPSPKPFEWVVDQLGVSKEACLVVGDSVRRDLGGALAANIDCVLVGGACDDRALASYANLIKFAECAKNTNKALFQ